MKTLTYKGFIDKKLYYNHDTLYIGKTIITKELYTQTEYEKITIRYWISDNIFKNIINKEPLNTLEGKIHANYKDFYSHNGEYEYTDEILKVGKYDLLKELQSNLGKYIWLEIDIHK